MQKLFDSSIEKIIAGLGKQRIGRRIFAFENLIEKRIIRDGGTPIVEGNTAYFLFKNEEKKKISVVGDWNNWKPDTDLLAPINPRSSIFFCKKEFPIDSRLSYRFLAEGEESFNDPLNPNSLQEVFGNNTFLKMPAYVEPQYFEEPVREVSRGKIIQLSVKGNKDVADRKVQVYMPSDLRLRSKLRVMYVNDGAEAITIGKFRNVLDNLFYYEPHIQKTIVAFVPPVDRHVEYMFNPKFSEWFANDLTAQVEKKLKIKTEARLRAVQGASLGGLHAANIGLNHSDKFGNIIAQSPSFWIENGEIIKLFAKSKLLPLRFYLHTGTINDALEGTSEMLQALQQKGYAITYRQTNESHNWANWSGKYAEIIRWMSTSLTN
jgi:enterochelin esterase-like enzyme